MAPSAPRPSSPSSPLPSSAPAVPAAVKILIAGGFGVGKTTLVGAVSEVAPLRTEEYLTRASEGVDDLAGVDNKETTTVALDFGRITVNPELVVYLFGTPGQERFWFMWNDLVNGALGGVVIADTRRLDTSFASIDFFESRGIPFVVAINCFHGHNTRTADEIRAALDLDPQVPMLIGDVRVRTFGRDLLLALVDHLMELSAGAPVR
ncbi:GTP-binding protein [Kitasatospora purpeofusca]|uniref:GTP-binding protein n=1 Tax=Kitasatospora purpeofusca TaxID=67352 RepID=UPI002251BB4C|nr:ATP/GTP-binding protein [Kitasatospora purpeofusca]MCX4756958.1 ATP/GTP-binding protein [Kitasatospora purpeofusca]WSR35274.1 ATP/GTP-binding protein [Kitasatospora purpeofusca]WSR43594.1 ATP/GTP-binding protein [Kitasatospora purpeofusca]